MIYLETPTPARVAVEIERALETTKVVAGDDDFWGDTTYAVTRNGRIESYRRNFDAVSKAFKSMAMNVADCAPPLTNPIDQFLNELYAIQIKGETKYGVDLVFSTLHFWLSRGVPEFCDAILRKLDVSRLDSDLLISFLTITFPAREQLRERAAYYDRARRKIRKDLGWFVARRILVGLK